MPGLEIYELWLRTGWADPEDWLEFLCEGEGVFGDCTSTSTSTSTSTGGLAQSQLWPGEGQADSVTLNNQIGL